MPETKKSPSGDRRDFADRDLPEPMADQIAKRQGKHFAPDGRKVKDLSHVGNSGPDTDADETTPTHDTAPRSDRETP